METQSQSALEGIWMQMTIYPVIGMIIGLAIFILFYKLDEKKVEEMIVAMDRGVQV